MYLGTSIGIAIRGDDLEVVCLRRRYEGIAVSGFLRIENYAARPVEEAAAQYRRFREENHAQTVSAVLALPRSMGLIRTIELPREALPNLAQAVAYQVDALHPFEEGAVYHDHALLAGPPAGGASPAGGENGASAARLRVAVAIVERSALDRLAGWCGQAGIDLSAVTFSTGALYQALARAAGARRNASALIAFDQHGESLEVLGMAADGAFCSREIRVNHGPRSADFSVAEAQAGAGAAQPAPRGPEFEREMTFCIAELRLPAGHEPRVVWLGDAEPAAGEAAGALGQTVAVAPEDCGNVALRVRAAGFVLSTHFAAYAAGLGGLERSVPLLPRPPGLRWNLLPAERRVFRSHWGRGAAVVLATLVALLAIAWPATGWVQDRLYASWLDAQVAALSPRVQYADKLDARQQELLSRLQLLRDEGADINHKLDAWLEVTRLAPPTAWLNSLQISGSDVTLVGTADSATPFLQALSQSPYFERAEFVSAIGKSADGRETFQIRMRLRPAPPAPLSVPAGAAAGPAGPAPPAASEKGE